MSNWDRTGQIASKHEGSGGTWLRLAGDGNRAVVVFCGEPHPREVVFVDGGYKPFTDELAAQGLKPSLRVAINVVVLPTREVKVFEFGVGLFKDVVKVREKYGLEGWAFEVARSGGPKDPKTSYTILPERQLTAEEQQSIASLSLKDLASLYDGKPAAAGNAKGAAGGSEFDAPIDEKTAQELTTVLKSLPTEAVSRFCERFGVERLRQLPASLADKARAYVASLRADYPPPVEKDPFA